MNKVYLFAVIILFTTCDKKKDYEIINNDLIILLEEYIDFLDKNKGVFTKKSSILLTIYPHKKLQDLFWIHFDYNNISDCHDYYVCNIPYKGYEVTLLIYNITAEKLKNENLIKINKWSLCEKKENQDKFNTPSDIVSFNEAVSFSYIYDGDKFESYNPNSKYWNPPVLDEQN